MTKTAKTRNIRYEEGCLAAHALNLIGDRWALLVVRELMFAPKRFQMIRAGMPGITASVLTGRLAQLVGGGVVHHDERLGIYSLTDQGRGLLPVLEALCQWALAVPGHDPSFFISPSSLVISMGVTFVPELAAGHEMTGGFDFGGEAFEVEFAGGKVQSKSVAAPDASFILRGNGNQLAAAVYGKTPLEDLISRGIVRAEGDVDAARVFLSVFRLAPKKVPEEV